MLRSLGGDDKLNSAGVMGEPRAASWAKAFEIAFGGIDWRILGNVRFHGAFALDPDHVAVVYRDHFGRVAGRIYSLGYLEELTLGPEGRVDVARQFILGDLIEPSPPGRDLEHEMLGPIKAQFPDIKWSGDIDSPD